MNIVLPVSDMDLPLAVLLAKRLTALGGLQNDRLIIASSKRAYWDIEEVMKALPGAELFVLPSENEEGWPVSCGHAFFELFQWLADGGNSEPTMYLEADCFPLRTSWLAEIKTEYAREGKPFWGKVEPSRWLTPGKEVVIKGSHLVGGGGSIYPGNLFELAPSATHLSLSIPYDIEIGPEVVPHTFATELVAHRFRTCNYRVENGELVCDNFAPKPFQHLYAAPIPPTVCLLHGLKDSSLYKALDPLGLSA